MKYKFVPSTTFDVEIALVTDAEVIRPLLSTVITGIVVVLPYVPADTDVFANVNDIDVVPVPVASPVTEID